MRYYILTFLTSQKYKQDPILNQNPPLKLKIETYFL